ncbi:hypothetical protein [Anaerospora hongkongensis]|uniref:hypothetical protein n=1 Tax=Anaerospora hongkongensis TaxID=244830 RepID=UPI002FD9C10B
MKRFAEIWRDIETAKEEARSIMEEGKLLQQRRSCDLVIDTDGVVYKCGNFPDATQMSQMPIHREYIWWASCEPNWKSEWEVSYISRMDRYELEKWLKKAREKLHHVSVPLRRRVNINKRLISDRIAVIEATITSDQSTSSDIKNAIKAISGIMNHLRSIEKELKMQVNPKLTAFKK